MTALAVREQIQQGDLFMSKHGTISSGEAADRLAIREFVEGYAHCADRRDAKGQMSLFTKDT
jgi:SnoaL-like domain